MQQASRQKEENFIQASISRTQSAQNRAILQEATALAAKEQWEEAILTAIDTPRA